MLVVGLDVGGAVYAWRWLLVLMLVVGGIVGAVFCVVLLRCNVVFRVASRVVHDFCSRPQYVSFVFVPGEGGCRVDTVLWWGVRWRGAINDAPVGFDFLLLVGPILLVCFTCGNGGGMALMVRGPRAREHKRKYHVCYLGITGLPSFPYRNPEPPPPQNPVSPPPLRSFIYFSPPGSKKGYERTACGEG